MATNPRIHILDDDPSFGKLLAANLGREGKFRIEVFTNPTEFLGRVAGDLPDAVITDLVMPELDGVEVTRRLRAAYPLLPVFVLTAHGEIESAVEALKAGATEYLTKPVNMEELVTFLRRSLEERPLREEAAGLKDELKERFSAQAILGEHPKVEEVRRFIGQVAAIPKATVILLGESGTGKNLAARTIHYSGARAAKRFVEVNCASLPPELLEAELFGHTKGAFTGAHQSKRGLIEVADGGTLFLDEIGDLPLAVQAKLLNFLESRRFRRVGSTQEIQADLHLITATNRDLDERIREGKFREDLYYRIRVATHTLPPLREIRQDIPLLVDHFRGVFNREFGKAVESVSPEALEWLTQWDWPGNVRELRNVMERAMIFAAGSVLTSEALAPLEVSAGINRGAEAPVDGDWFPIPKDLTLSEVEKEYTRWTMTACEGNVRRAAEILGISRKNLWEKRKKHGLLE